MSGSLRRSSRSLTARQRASSATNYTDDDEILPADTPSWGKSLYRLFNDSILPLVTKLTNIKTEIRSANKALSLAKANRSAIDLLTSKVDSKMAS